MALAGSLACQRDSYLRQLTTKVVSCEAAQLSTVVNGKKQKLSGFEVTLEDTVLFPEGGGQPDDRGTINDIPVLRVIRRGGAAIHFVPSPLDLESEVEVKVDWDRRWDHMTQHSGQHLVTALADQMYGFKTTSWNLGDKTSFIELDTASMSDHQVSELEAVTNDKIRACTRMYPTAYDSKDAPKLREVRARGLPEDHIGQVRVVTIEGIDDNMCCGTHISNLAHLQAIKLLGVEKGKKGKVNLVFLAGRRVTDYLGQCYEREKAITGIIKGGPDQHADLVSKLQASYTQTRKNATNLLREVALLEAQKYNSMPDKPPYFFMHKKEGDNEFMNIIVNEINNENTVIFLSTGDEKGAGLFLLSGQEELIAELGPKILEILDGKGAGKSGRYQGKANKLSGRPKVESLIKEKIGCGDSQ